MESVSSNATTKLDLIPGESGVRRIGKRLVHTSGKTATVLAMSQIRDAMRGREYTQYCSHNNGTWRASVEVDGVEVACAYRDDANGNGMLAALNAVAFDLLAMGRV